MNEHNFCGRGTIGIQLVTYGGSGTAVSTSHLTPQIGKIALTHGKFRNIPLARCTTQEQTLGCVLTTWIITSVEGLARNNTQDVLLFHGFTSATLDLNQWPDIVKNLVIFSGCVLCCLLLFGAAIRCLLKIWCLASNLYQKRFNLTLWIPFRKQRLS